MQIASVTMSKLHVAQESVTYYREMIKVQTRRANEARALAEEALKEAKNGQTNKKTHKYGSGLRLTKKVNQRIIYQRLPIFPVMALRDFNIFKCISL